MKILITLLSLLLLLGVSLAHADQTFTLTQPAKVFNASSSIVTYTNQFTANQVAIIIFKNQIQLQNTNGFFCSITNSKDFNQITNTLWPRIQKMIQKGRKAFVLSLSPKP